jgi:hypothetical protein
LTFWEKYGWHVARFFPHKKKLWYHQEAVSDPMGDMKFGFDSYGTPGMSIESSGIYRAEFRDIHTTPAQKLGDYQSELMQYRGGPNTIPEMEPPMLKNAEVRNLVKVLLREGYIPPNAEEQVNEACYGKLNSRTNTLNYIIFFVERM